MATMWNNQANSGWQLRASPLELLISRAASAHLPEPNYAFNLEVAEYINTKKANNPREGAMTTVRLVNNRNPHISMLALALLDTLVQNCGYPFHLQIATKEFLNELVRRFPERPPPFPGPVMTRILELIHTWKETICQDSRYKDDLGNIRDMHRLLQFKGYRFRDLPRANVPSPAANLKSAEELENEDREAQSAKLQELIRRGTPRDLAAAQELMKSLSGANPEQKPDYRSQVLNELNKLEQKVVLLNEMLDNVDTERGEKFVSGDVYDQVSQILIASRPKIQKWISDAESDDSESLDTYLQINDQINTVLIRYEAFQKGDYSVAKNPIPAELASGTNASTSASLIDFDDGDEAAASSSNSNPLNDLDAIFGSTATPAPPPVPTQSKPLANFSAPSYASPAPSFTSTAQPAYAATTPSPPRPESAQFGSIMLPGTPTGSPQPPQPRTWGGMSPPPATNTPSHFSAQTQAPSAHPMQPGVFSSMMQPQQQMFPPMQPQSGAPATQQQQPPQSGASASGGAKKDPFADLVGLF